MAKIKITNSRRYADPKGPHMPQVEFVEGLEYDVSNELAESVIANGDGHLVDEDKTIETKVVDVESKDQVSQNTDLTGDIDELAELRAQADELNIKIDKRWGEDRLKTEIESACNAG